MKAHRLKTGFTSKEDLRYRFNAELYSITDRIVAERTAGKGIVARIDFLRSKEYLDLYIEERAKLINSWSKRGIGMSFLSEPSEMDKWMSNIFNHFK